MRKPYFYKQASSISFLSQPPPCRLLPPASFLQPPPSGLLPPASSLRPPTYGIHRHSPTLEPSVTNVHRITTTSTTVDAPFDLRNTTSTIVEADDRRSTPKVYISHLHRNQICPASSLRPPTYGLQCLSPTSEPSVSNLHRITTTSTTVDSPFALRNTTSSTTVSPPPAPPISTIPAGRPPNRRSTSLHLHRNQI